MIEDVVTTGLSTSEVVNIVARSKGVVAGIGAVVNRSGKKLKELFTNASAHSLLDVSVKTWKASDCELCKKGIPAVKPGSRKK